MAKGVDIKIVYPYIRKRIAEQRLDFVLDMTDAYDGDELIYMGPSHGTANGNARIADRLHAVVGERLREKARAKRASQVGR